MSGQNLVLAISGPPGAGKTTLAEGVARRIVAEVLAFDAYETVTARDPDWVADWLARDAPYSEVRAPGLAEALCAASGPVVLDTPLGRAHPETGGLITHAVWIDCPPDLALARKLAQLAGAVMPREAAGFVEWLPGYLAAHERIVRPACAIQRARVAPLADLHVSALDVAEDIQRQVAAWITSG